MTRWQRIGHWLANPETGKAIALSLLAAAVIAFVITSGITTHEALKTRADTAARSARRIDLFTTQVGRLTIQVEKLRDQLLRHGIEPTVRYPAVQRISQPKTTTTTTSSPSTTTTTSTTEPATCVGLLCVRSAP